MNLKEELARSQRFQQLEESGLPERWKHNDYTFASFGPHVTEENREPASAIRRWAKEIESSWLYVWGQTGRGKSGLAAAAFKEKLSKQGDYGRGCYLNAARWIAEMRSGYARGDSKHSAELLDRAIQADVLFVDDFAVNESVSPFLREQLYTLIDARYSEGPFGPQPTVFTSMYDLPTAAQRLGGDDLAAAICWRIRESAEVVNLRGPNLRATVRSSVETSE